MASPRKSPNLDTVTTINRDGSRLFLHPSDVKGRFTVWRRISGYLLIAFFIALPWIPVGGHPAVFMDIAARRFHLFGITFAAQDMWLLFFLITGMAFLLFYVTALFGRVWCGWACPQTVYLEHVYRRIERLLEGDAPQRRRLDKAPWSTHKVLLRGTKHTLFVIVSFLIAHIFFAYFVSIPRMWEAMTHNPADNLRLFFFVFAGTGLLYANFAWFREQLCIVICPYGRLQSALIDDHTLNVGYDEKRGEPRGKATDPNAGDCIACNRCVQVCPTGIDIRQGTQLECVGCANCIDACNAVMKRLDRPQGLIRYDSLIGFSGGKTRFLRARTLLYTALLFIGASVAAYSISGLSPVEANVTRMTGMPFYVTQDTVRNQFRVRLVNKTNQPANFTVSLVDPPEGVSASGFETPARIAPMGEETRPFIVHITREAYTSQFSLTLAIDSDSLAAPLTETIEFLGPDAALLKDSETQTSSDD